MIPNPSLSSYQTQGNTSVIKSDPPNTLIQAQSRREVQVVDSAERQSALLTQTNQQGPENGLAPSIPAASLPIAGAPSAFAISGDRTCDKNYGNMFGNYQLVNKIPATHQTVSVQQELLANRKMIQELQEQFVQNELIKERSSSKKATVLEAVRQGAAEAKDFRRVIPRSNRRRDDARSRRRSTTDYSSSATSTMRSRGRSSDRKMEHHAKVSRRGRNITAPPRRRTNRSRSSATSKNYSSCTPSSDASDTDLYVSCSSSIARKTRNYHSDNAGYRNVSFVRKSRHDRYAPNSYVSQPGAFFPHNFDTSTIPHEDLNRAFKHLEFYFRFYNISNEYDKFAFAFSKFPEIYRSAFLESGRSPKYKNLQRYLQKYHPTSESPIFKDIVLTPSRPKQLQGAIENALIASSSKRREIAKYLLYSYMDRPLKDAMKPHIHRSWRSFCSTANDVIKQLAARPNARPFPVNQTAHGEASQKSYNRQNPRHFEHKPPADTNSAVNPAGSSATINVSSSPDLCYYHKRFGDRAKCCWGLPCPKYTKDMVVQAKNEGR